MAFAVPSLTYSRFYLSLVRPKISDAKHVDFSRPAAASAFRLPCLKSSIFGTAPCFFGKVLPKGIHAAIPVTPLLGAIDVLDAIEDEYGGVVVNPSFLPNTSNAFASSLQSSLSYWSQQGKRGVWLKILEGQADLVPIAIKARFIYHHAEPGYVMLTFWLPDGPSALPSTALHQIGIGAFVMNDKREVLVVKERKCTLCCSGIWKIPTGFIDKSEDLFSGAIREVKEETGIETSFLDVVAFRYIKYKSIKSCTHIKSLLRNQIYSFFARSSHCPLTSQLMNRRLKQQCGCGLMNFSASRSIRRMKCARP
ncbi:nudix hydrolase 8-like isoform X5 [Phragmites australis]|uniref:nudix hydrolase 8-like isoform X5 n=1 Tax=Phragmites australis TaxID=29695 RepID=UPI002D790764|nr:nudix hydrolase 8-like isoform X5 [Phragmites australis]